MHNQRVQSCQGRISWGKGCVDSRCAQPWRQTRQDHCKGIFALVEPSSSNPRQLQSWHFKTKQVTTVLIVRSEAQTCTMNHLLTEGKEMVRLAKMPQLHWCTQRNEVAGPGKLWESRWRSAGKDGRSRYWGSGQWSQAKASWRRDYRSTRTGLHGQCFAYSASGKRLSRSKLFGSIPWH